MIVLLKTLSLPGTNAHPKSQKRTTYHFPLLQQAELGFNHVWVVHTVYTLPCFEAHNDILSKTGKRSHALHQAVLI